MSLCSLASFPTEDRERVSIGFLPTNRASRSLLPRASGHQVFRILLRLPRASPSASNLLCRQAVRRH